MKITVTYHASARERVGGTEKEHIHLHTTHDAQPLATRHLRAALLQRHHDLKELLPTCALAVNCVYAHDDTVLRDGDEVAILPPVSGG